MWEVAVSEPRRARARACTHLLPPQPPQTHPHPQALLRLNLACTGLARLFSEDEAAPVLGGLDALQVGGAGFGNRPDNSGCDDGSGQGGGFGAGPSG